MATRLKEVKRIKYILNEATNVLAESLDPRKILLGLKARHVLNDSEVSGIKHHPEEDEQVDSLLTKLKRKDKGSYEVFLELLQEERKDLYEHIKSIEEKYDRNRIPALPVTSDNHAKTTGREEQTIRPTDIEAHQNGSVEKRVTRQSRKWSLLNPPERRKKSSSRSRSRSRSKSKKAREAIDYLPNVAYEFMKCKIAEKLTERDLQIMIKVTRADLNELMTGSTADDFFTCLERKNLMSEDNLYYIQYLLHECEKHTAIEVVDNYAKPRANKPLILKKIKRRKPAKGTNFVEFRIQGDFKHAKMADVSKFKKFLSEKLNINRRHINIVGTGNGSIVLVFQLPTIGIERLNQAINERQAWLKERGVLQVHMDGEGFAWIQDEQSPDISVTDDLLSTQQSYSSNQNEVDIAKNGENLLKRTSVTLSDVVSDEDENHLRSQKKKVTQDESAVMHIESIQQKDQPCEKLQPDCFDDASLSEPCSLTSSQDVEKCFKEKGDNILEDNSEGSHSNKSSSQFHTICTPTANQQLLPVPSTTQIQSHLDGHQQGMDGRILGESEHVNLFLDCDSDLDEKGEPQKWRLRKKDPILEDEQAKVVDEESEYTPKVPDNVQKRENEDNTTRNGSNLLKKTSATSSNLDSNDDDSQWQKKKLITKELTCMHRMASQQEHQSHETLQVGFLTRVSVSEPFSFGPPQDVENTEEDYNTPSEVINGRESICEESEPDVERYKYKNKYFQQKLMITTAAKDSSQEVGTNSNKTSNEQLTMDSDKVSFQKITLNTTKLQSSSSRNNIKCYQDFIHDFASESVPRVNEADIAHQIYHPDTNPMCDTLPMTPCESQLLQEDIKKRINRHGQDGRPTNDSTNHLQLTIDRRKRNFHSGIHTQCQLMQQNEMDRTQCFRELNRSKSNLNQLGGHSMDRDERVTESLLMSRRVDATVACPPPRPNYYPPTVAAPINPSYIPQCDLYRRQQASPSSDVAEDTQSGISDAYTVSLAKYLENLICSK